ncbi:MAG: hypothetical protein HC924_09980 [Synechococcaceae cyanobacterium SM2_3_2]|nr:hypothetical protein [Synechococcaceae cyanobacterium SM2_3_2]
MNSCFLHLGSILKTAVELSQNKPSPPSLDQIQHRTHLSTDQMVNALELEPNPLGWHLEPLSEQLDQAFWVRGKPYGVLVIDRFA